MHERSRQKANGNYPYADDIVSSIKKNDQKALGSSFGVSPEHVISILGIGNPIRRGMSLGNEIVDHDRSLSCVLENQ
jgi:hypothetical protein